MHVKVKYFALLRELAGKREEDVEIDEEMRVGASREAVRKIW